MCGLAPGFARMHRAQLRKAGLRCPSCSARSRSRIGPPAARWPTRPPSTSTATARWPSPPRWSASGSETGSPSRRFALPSARGWSRTTIRAAPRRSSGPLGRSATRRGFPGWTSLHECSALRRPQSRCPPGGPPCGGGGSTLRRVGATGDHREERSCGHHQRESPIHDASEGPSDSRAGRRRPPVSEGRPASHHCDSTGGYTPAGEAAAPVAAEEDGQHDSRRSPPHRMGRHGSRGPAIHESWCVGNGIRGSRAAMASLAPDSISPLRAPLRSPPARSASASRPRSPR